MVRSSTTKVAGDRTRGFTRGMLSRAVMAAALALPLVGVGVSGAWAQEAPAAGASATLAPIDAAVQKSADNYWHYVQVARYELANAEAKALAENTDALMVLRAFEAVATDRKADLDTYVARWTSLEATKDAATVLKATLDKGRLELRGSPAFIEENIKRLIINERAYQLAVARLRSSGELAVPRLVEYLRDSDKVQYHGSVRRALTDMGKHALSPLLAATEMKDSRVLVVIAHILGDMGYEPAVPYLLKLSSSSEVGSSVRQASAAALTQLNASGTLTAADAFYQLGEKFYYDNAMITADLSQAPEAYVWSWSEANGLGKKSVPPAIFNELMAMRAAEYALGLDQGKAEALSLWLAANYKREVELPAGAKDATRAEGQPDAHYYGVASGARYLNDVLARAIKDRNSAVALRAVKSLQEIVGQSSLFGNGATTPLTVALSYPDRLVRFESAYAIASSKPTQPFVGSDQVVPILAEAIAQTGKPGVVVVATSDESLNKLVEELKGQGYNAVGAKSAEGAVTASASIPSVDAVVIAEEVALGTVDQLLAISANSPRLGRTPKVVLTKTSVSPFASRAAADVLVNTSTATDVAGIKEAIEKARVRGGGNPQDEAAATAGALKALGLIGELAVSKSPTLDLTAARPTVIGALDDARPEVIKAAADALAVFGQREGQVALVAKATSDKTPAELRVPLLKALSTSAKNFGNQLPADGIAAIEKLVTTAESLEVRGAAAETRGALNLAPDEAKALILKHAAK